MLEPSLLQVIQPGMLTTVQDLGRSGQARFGVALGGALDREALTLGNRLLGNDPASAGLEITLMGPRLCFTTDTAIALAGGDLGAKLNGQSVPLWRPVIARAGDFLSFDPSAAGLGARAYLCVAGGIDVDPVMGSRSTDLIGAFGGWHGRALKTGDELPIGRSELPFDSILGRRLTNEPWERSSELTARVVLGPQADRFTEAGVSTFFGSVFAVSSKSNRQGIRLDGPVIEHTRGADLVSEGIAHGAVQVPGNGHPIVLLAGRQTVGGYVKIATVIGADLDRFGQLRPSDKVRFTAVSVQEARQATLEYRARLGPESVIESERSYPGASIYGQPQGLSESEIEQLGGAWDPEGVIRVIEALERTGASGFSLEVAGLSLKLLRGSSGWIDDSSAGTEPKSTAVDPGIQNETCVTAPVLGVFYRRSAPDQPALAEEGAAVKASQLICVLEVMKTYHEVTAPRDGILAAFLVEEGQFVEYGQAIARIDPH